MMGWKSTSLISHICEYIGYTCDFSFCGAETRPRKINAPVVTAKKNMPVDSSRKNKAKIPCVTQVFIRPPQSKRQAIQSTLTVARHFYPRSCQSAHASSAATNRHGGGFPS